eukprot:CAMPEP_0179186166 /NCGR_PEP_ID=MMETSP0796-20121207/92327_1 /TAXON_ID=73915 /ORGANISM="Pyrodinium bahamense, Strain pbaha01" /LENGTH=169 /DNA_ID=CAMNT_0020890143 /DNA_START=108 /DNA_END=618 /DNA_ORIENTATION=-
MREQELDVLFHQHGPSVVVRVDVGVTHIEADVVQPGFDVLILVKRQSEEVTGHPGRPRRVKGQGQRDDFDGLRVLVVHDAVGRNDHEAVADPPGMEYKARSCTMTVPSTLGVFEVKSRDPQIPVKGLPGLVLEREAPIVLGRQRSATGVVHADAKGVRLLRHEARIVKF